MQSIIKMSDGYVALPRQSEDDLYPKEKGTGEYQNSSHLPRRNQRTVCLLIILTASLILNIVVLGLWQRDHGPAAMSLAPSSYGTLNIPNLFNTLLTFSKARSLELPTVYKPLHWNTQWSSANHTLQDQLWNDILPSHGFVAINRRSAAGSQYPESMYLPGDKSKGVYLLEAYHQLHCLKILHRTMRESLTGAEFTWKPGSHIEHCFDYLVQITMCNADTTPLYTFGDDTAGDGQVHKCKDWNALREYSTENRACYRDTVEDVLLGQHFGYCDDGWDGMEEPRRVERVVDSNRS